MSCCLKEYEMDILLIQKLCFEHDYRIFDYFFKSSWKSKKNISRYCTSMTRLPQVTPQTSSTNFSQTHSWAVQSWGDQNYGSYYTWTRSCSLLESKIQFLHCSRRSCKKLSKSSKQSGAPNFFIQHDKVDDSKLRRYLEAFWCIERDRRGWRSSVAIAEKIITFLMDKKSIRKREMKVRREYEG